MEITRWSTLLRRRARLLGGVVLGVLLLGLLLSFVRDDEYVAVAEVQLSAPDNALLLGVDAGEPDVAAELRTAQSDAVKDKVEGGADGVSVTGDEVAQVLTFTATASTAQGAAERADAYAKAYVKLRTERAEKAVGDAVDRLEQKIAELDGAIEAAGTSEAAGRRVAALTAQRASYREAADQLEVSLLVGGASGARQVAPAEVPDSPSGPGTAASLAYALLGGLLLGVAAVAVAEALDRTVKDPDDVATATGGYPVLARLDAGGRPPSGAAGDVAPYRALRSTIRSRLDTTRPVVQVTSAARPDGAPAVALGLAVALAQGGVPTALLCTEAPAGVTLERPVIDASNPLAPLVGDDAPDGSWIGLVDGVDDLVVVVRPDDGRDTVVPGSARDALKLLEPVTDAVVVLSPPVRTSPVAVELGDLVDGTVLVARERVTGLADLEEAGHALSLLRAPTVGVVLA